MQSAPGILFCLLGPQNLQTKNATGTRERAIQYNTLCQGGTVMEHNSGAVGGLT